MNIRAEVINADFSEFFRRNKDNNVEVAGWSDGAMERAGGELGGRASGLIN